MYILKFLFLFLFINSAVHADTLSGTRPNIILIITDDQGYGPIGAHGHPWIKTPNLDKLYSESTRFERFLVSPTCSPTRAAIMSGRHPLKNGVTHTILERERMALGTFTVAQALQSVNYQTGIFGKWHLGDEKLYQPENRGFSEVFIHGAGGIGQAYACSCADAPGNKYFDPVIRYNGEFVKTKGYCTDIFFKAALGWIKKVKNESDPFFAYITTNAPHGPFIAPPSNTKKFKDMGFKGTQAGFYGMIENIDENIGLLLEKISEWDLDKETLIIFMSDNGMTGGGSGRPGKEVAKGYPFFNAGQKGLKGGVDEGGVRVPFFVRWPGVVRAGARSAEPIIGVDLLPTLCEMMEAPLPVNQRVDGVSLVPLLSGQKTRLAPRSLFWHFPAYLQAYSVTNEQRDPLFRSRPCSIIRDGHWKLHHYLEDNAVELYDLSTDIGERYNLASIHPNVASRLREKLESWRVSSEAAMPEGLNPLYDPQMEKAALLRAKE